MNKVKLFCIPYAGGSANIYKTWNEYFGDNVEINPLELPGRGRKFGEELCDELRSIAIDFYHEIKHKLNSPYIIFGHSMGATIAHELVHYISKQDILLPEYLIVSGRKNPLEERIDFIADLPEDEFKLKIKSKGGTPKQFFENTELLELFLPILRNDFRSVEKYKYDHLTKLDTKLVALYGSDEDISSEDINKWAKFTTSEFDAFEIEGDHFFINQNTKQVASVIDKLVNGLRKRKLG
ncbi:thioesterase domain-containing protein [Clostridiaceae bacterium M8S5]|nr:thioesterase domain-containing protein [Clostridiaceae bacterium M8S5]